ncbi:xylose isomerase [Amyelois transitella]|uniref:xylose isomerase n=1 Tax=Amyelois transitella TaxID=680683 RepID=UPI0029907AF1|nr:xylose isomerase [Amyelois transitella]
MSYNQPGAKRPKRPDRPDVDYFQGIDKLEYNNMAGPGEAGHYRYYNSSERLCSRSMEDWLKFSVSLTEFRNYGYDNFGRPSPHRQWDDGTKTIDNHKRCIKALFDLCNKLGVKYWTAYDSDLIPFGDSWEETRVQWDEMVEFVQELGQKMHLKCLWLAPDLHSHPRYSLGALTNSDANVFAQAATQIKKCLEVSQRLNAECFLLWPSREGYENTFHTDIAKEIKLFGKLLKLTAEYKDRLNYRCQLLLMPYYSFGRNCGGWQHWWEKEMVNMYVWDVTSCLYLLKNYNLDRYYKVCTPPGHHMYMANIYNMLGGVFLTNHFDHYDTKSLTLMMKCIVEQGSAPPGGVHLKLLTRASSAPREQLSRYVSLMDACARALRLAAHMAQEQYFSKHLQQRYSSYHSGFGSRLVGSDVSMEECEEHYKKNHAVQPESPRLELLDISFQRYLDTCDRI